jgi:hypothetical protein
MAGVFGIARWICGNDESPASSLSPFCFRSPHLCLSIVPRTWVSSRTASHPRSSEYEPIPTGGPAARVCEQSTLQRHRDIRYRHDGADRISDPSGDWPAFALGLMALVPVSGVLVAASVLFGFTVGNVTTLAPIIVRPEFGAETFGAIFGIASAGAQLAAALGRAFMVCSMTRSAVIGWPC